MKNNQEQERFQDVKYKDFLLVLMKKTRGEEMRGRRKTQIYEKQNKREEKTVKKVKNCCLFFCFWGVLTQKIKT